MRYSVLTDEQIAKMSVPEIIDTIKESENRLLDELQIRFMQTITDDNNVNTIASGKRDT